MGTTESILTVEDDGEYDSAAKNNGIENSPEKVQRSTGNGQRRRIRPQHVSTLHGVVIGLPLTGKKSLLQRLVGRDPFSQEGQGNNDCEHITIPYKAPGETWGERIQLTVEVSSSFDKLPNFYVAMINPRHDPRTLKPYLMKLLAMLIKEGGSKALSICILVNFRDEHESRPVRVSEADIKEWIKDAMEQSPSDTAPLIETGVISLKNCYGLITLHHFIYRAFLYRKQRLLEYKLQKVAAEVGKSQKLPTQTYEEFLCILNGGKDKKQAALSIEKQVNEDVSSIPSPEKILPSVPPASEHNPKSEQKVEKSEQKVTQARREVYSFNKPPTGVNTKISLDDFFADDDDDDDGGGTMLNSHQANLEDKEDDFYYGEDGQRIGASDSEESEEVDPKTLPERIKAQSMATKGKEGRREKDPLGVSPSKPDQGSQKIECKIEENHDMYSKSQFIKATKDQNCRDKGGGKVDDRWSDESSVEIRHRSKPETQEDVIASENPRRKGASVLSKEDNDDVEDGWGDDDLSLDNNDSENSKPENEKREYSEDINRESHIESASVQEKANYNDNSTDSSEDAKTLESQEQTNGKVLDKKEVEDDEDERNKCSNIGEGIDQTDTNPVKEPSEDEVDDGNSESKVQKVENKEVLDREIEDSKDDQKDNATLREEITNTDRAFIKESSEKDDDETSELHELEEGKKEVLGHNLKDSEGSQNQISPGRNLKAQSLKASSIDFKSPEQDGWGDEDLDLSDDESVERKTEAETTTPVQNIERNEQKPARVFEDDDRADGYMIDAAAESQLHSDDGDDDYIIGNSFQPTAATAQILSQQLKEKDVANEETANTSSSSIGLSAEALSALQAAQEQARLMLDTQEQSNNQLDKSQKKKKKKKEKGEKKEKKKKKKSKSSTSELQ